MHLVRFGSHKICDSPDRLTQQVQSLTKAQLEFPRFCCRMLQCIGYLQVLCQRIVVDSSWTCDPQCIGSLQVLCQRIVVDSSWTCDPQCIGSLQVLCQRIVVDSSVHRVSSSVVSEDCSRQLVDV